MGHMTALQKEDGGVRDIIVGDIFRRGSRHRQGVRLTGQPRFFSNSMFSGMHRVVDGDQMIPFVKLFYRSLSVYLWEDDMGDTHEIVLGEGPSVWGSTFALMSVNERFIEKESFFVFLDLHVLCLPERVIEVQIQQELWSRANIRVHHGKTGKFGTGQASSHVGAQS